MLCLPGVRGWDKPGKLGSVLVLLQAGVAGGRLCFPLPCNEALCHVPCAASIVLGVSPAWNKDGSLPNPGSQGNRAEEGRRDAGKMHFTVWILLAARYIPRRRSPRLDVQHLWLCHSPAPADPNPTSLSLALRKPTLISLPGDLLLFPSPICVTLGLLSWLFNPAGRILQALPWPMELGAQPALALPGHGSGRLVLNLVSSHLSMLSVQQLMVRRVSLVLKCISFLSANSIQSNCFFIAAIVLRKIIKLH